MHYESLSEDQTFTRFNRSVSLSMKRSKRAKRQHLLPNELDKEVARILSLSIAGLRVEWLTIFGSKPPAALTKDLLARAITYRLQENETEGLSPHAVQALRDHGVSKKASRHVKTGSTIVREYHGVLHQVLVVPGGFFWQGKTFDSLSVIAKQITGTNWNGPRFFGLRKKRGADATSLILGGQLQLGSASDQAARPLIAPLTSAKLSRGGGRRSSILVAASRLASTGDRQSCLPGRSADHPS